MADKPPAPAPNMAAERVRRLEGRSLLIAMWGNLFMAVAGIAAAILSNSIAIMTDGLFSLIGFTAAFLGRRISQKVEAGPDRVRPMGYAADEALFATFRALSLLGLVFFAVASASMSIYKYLSGGTPPELVFAPMLIYFTLIGTTCFLLWALHHWTWSRTAKTSDILRLEAKASMFDGIITAAAALGLGTVFVFRDGFLAPIAPIGDSIVVIILCLFVVGQYRRDLMAGMGELAGVTAPPATLAVARRAIRPAIAEHGGTLTDLSVTKLGRSHFVTAYYDPGCPVTASQIDEINLRMIADLRADLPGADVLLVITEHPRRWPDEISPS